MKRLTWFAIVGLVLAGCGRPQPAPSTLRKSCALFVSCATGPFAGFTPTACGRLVAGFEARYAVGVLYQEEEARIANCANGASTCTEWQNCVSLNHGPAYCSAHRGESCDGNVLVECPSGGQYARTVVDCAARGQRCQTVNDHASCTNGVSCDPSGSPRCDGNRAINCDGDTRLEEVTDCGAALPGSTCGVVTTGSRTRATCLPPGLPCQSADPRCDGNVLVICDNNRERRIDCAGVFQGICGIADGRAQCVFQGECSPESSPDRCNGNVLEACVNGRYEGTDCRSIGFNTCGMRSIFGRDVGAACTN